MSLRILSNLLHADATAILVFDGPPNVAVGWSVVGGSGTITPLSGRTDAQGRAWAKFDPIGIGGTATVEVEHGT
ncbi:hypothetical protein AU476_07525 [Cupriavidus sp. UYMSc13B]|nr:hypothetical protein AU476_07525 [Cupriavidus sp. UYMSc13B]